MLGGQHGDSGRGNCRAGRQPGAVPASRRADRRSRPRCSGVLDPQALRLQSRLRGDDSGDEPADFGEPLPDDGELLCRRTQRASDLADRGTRGGTRRLPALHVEGSDPCDRRRAHHHSDCPQPPACLSVGPKLPAFNNASTSRPSLCRGPYRWPSAQSVPGRRRQAPDDTPDTLPGPALKGVVQRQGELGDPPPTEGPAQAELVDPSRDHLDALAGVPRLHRIGPHLSGARRPSS